MHTVTIYHLKDLVGNNRRIIKCADVKYIAMPYFEGLSVEEILEWARNHDNGASLVALPITEKEILKLPREYIGNVIYTISGDPFQSWVDLQVVNRN